MRLGRYITAAFRNRWNLLFFASGVVFSFLTGRPDVVLPLVLAAEATYLGLLATHSKFQRAIDARAAKAQRQTSSEAAAQALTRIMDTLPLESVARYEKLRARCADLRQIARDLRATAAPDASGPLEDLQLAGLDRLLWIHIRLLYTEFNLRRFLEQTSDENINADIRRLEEQLAAYGQEEEDPHRRRARAAIEDNLKTSRARLNNLAKARSNHDLVQLEVDRLENKIRSLSEMAVNRQEPEFISHQVDSVAASMLATERTMEDLDFSSEFSRLDDAVPELLRQQQETESH